MAVDGIDIYSPILSSQPAESEAAQAEAQALEQAPPAQPVEGAPVEEPGKGENIDTYA